MKYAVGIWSALVYLVLRWTVLPSDHNAMVIALVIGLVLFSVGLGYIVGRAAVLRELRAGRKR